jgi:hypothetical protein
MAVMAPCLGLRCDVVSDSRSATGVPVDVQIELGELHDRDVMARDAESGLLDFPTLTDKGVAHLLCRKRDVEDLGWWHFAEEGIAGRKPLPLPPDL